MKILIITRHYLDENNGGSNCSKAYIRALADIYPDSTLIYPEHNDKTSRQFIPASINAIPCYDYRNKIQKGLDVYCGILHRATKFVAEHLSTNRYDIVFIDHSITANGIMDNMKKQGCKIVTIHHNNESQYIRDNTPSILYRIPYTYYAKKAERDALVKSDLNITLTEKDAISFRNLYPNRNIHCYNMGTFQYQNLPAIIQDDGIRSCHTFAITGSMNFKQSQGPVIEFIKRYFPLLLRKIPNAQLIIAGRNPSKRIKEACSKNNHITLIPNPENMANVILQADVYICPLNTGSGVKLRVMDGLKLGIPILGHTISMNGYESVQKDGFFFNYQDELSFERALENIVRLRYSKQQVYESFLSYFGFEMGKNRLKTILQQQNMI